MKNSRFHSEWSFFIPRVYCKESNEKCEEAFTGSYKIVKK